MESCVGHAWSLNYNKSAKAKITIALGLILYFLLIGGGRTNPLTGNKELGRSDWD